ncbi:MAG: hypothetical protein KF721_01005 [Ignavibacteriaceae bacterium]|nr:hypothetical protein [Ignavibacteriaceae bacterium]
MQEKEKIYRDSIYGVDKNSPNFQKIMDLHLKACEQEKAFYTDPVTGYSVFTAYYHLRRGGCCGSGCRHCPYHQE